MATGPMLLIAAFALLAGLCAAHAWPRFWLAVNVLAASVGLIAAITVLCGGDACDWRSAFRIGGEPLHGRLDGIGALFLALLCLVGGAATLYGRGYWTDAAHPRSASVGRRWWSMLLLSLGAVLVASNGLHFLIAWELFTLSAYFLVTLNRPNSDVRSAGWHYLGASHAASSMAGYRPMCSICWSASPRWPASC